MAALLVASKGVGFLRDPLIANLYGASAHSDSYYVALGISYLAYAVALGGMAASIVPVFMARRIHHGDASAWSFLGAYLTWQTLGFLVVAAVLTAWPGDIIHLLSPGLSGPAPVLAVTMVRILAFLPLLTALSMTVTSALNCYDRFLLPATLPLGGNVLSVVLLVLLTRRLGVVGAAWGLVIGTAFQAALVAFVAWRIARRFRPAAALFDGDLVRSARLAIPGIVSECLINVNYLFMLYLATSLGAGVFSSIQYSTKVQQVFVDVFIAAVGVVMFPQLARSAARGHGSHFRSLHTLNLTLAALVLLPITALVVLLRTEIIHLLYERRAFDAEATRVTAEALAFGALSLVPAGIKDAALRTFYSQHDSMTPLLAIAPAMALNVVLSFILVKPLGGAGLMLAFSLAMVFLAALLLIFLARRRVLRVGPELRRSLTNITAATAAMCVAVWVMRRGVSHLPQSWWSGAIELAACLGVGVAVYLGYLLLVRERDVRELADRIHHKVTAWLSKG